MIEFKICAFFVEILFSLFSSLSDYRIHESITMQLSRISRQLPANFYGPALTGTDANNFFHKSKFNSYHFQSDLPRLPIPTVEKTLSRYINSLEAQEGSVSSAQIDNVKSLAVSEKSKIDNLHQKLLDFDKENSHG